MKEIIVEKVIDGVSYKLRTGKLAKQADGSVVAQAGETMVLATAVADKKSAGFMDFFPLTVEFREKTYAAGKIPGGFIKRESRPSTDEILTARTIDRPIRPLFDEGFKAETQLIVNAISYDKENPFDVLGVTAASAALLISDIPFNIPVAAVRVVKKDGNFLVNPAQEILEECDINIDIAGTKDGITMVESEAKEVSEDDMVKALEIGHEYIKKIIDLQLELKEIAGKPKRNIDIIEPLDSNLTSGIKEKIIPELQQALSIKMKLERGDRLKQIFSDHVQPSIDEAEDKERTEFFLKELFEHTIKEVVRKKISTEGIRIDGRKLDEIRQITCETDLLPRAHGSSLFTRGETQSLGVATLGSSKDEQMIDGLIQESSSSKKFFLHYNFPPFSVGEVKRIGSVSRREIGHGNLAERALKMVMPKDNEFPYTVRLVSEVLESNGSSSMASICSGSMALMAAGVPIRHQVAGIAMGLIEEGDDFYVLSDILGDEDHFGDMDFKVAGTSNGITALQMDIKIKSLPLSVMAKALDQAKKGRMHILSLMNEAISEPRKELSKYAPRIESIMVDPDKIKDVIGPGGKMIKSIIEQTGVDIDIDSNGSGEVKIISNDSVMADKAKSLILSIVKDVEVDDIYKDAVVTRIMDFGAFVKITPTKEGLVHISQIAKARVNKVTDVLNVGDKIDVKVIKIDEQNRINLSRKALLEE